MSHRCTTAGPLFDSRVRSISEVNGFLRQWHYLGAARRGWAWVTDEGVMVWANPNSRYLPHDTWLELIRWCLRPGKNNGSRQWGGFRRWAFKNLPDITTLVSYSDPSVGHTGALYRACNWTWAPTWHRLRPPPTGNGSWSAAGQQSVKDRWIYPLRADDERPEILRIKDAALCDSVERLAV